MTGRKDDPFAKQRIVDILGILIPCGGLLVALYIEGFNPDVSAWRVICFEVLLLLLSLVRIFLFCSTHRGKRHQYSMHMIDSPRFFGRDTLIHPYTQTVIVVLFLFGTLAVGFRLA